MKKFNLLLCFCLIFCLIIFTNNLHIISDAVYAEENSNDVIVSVLGYGKIDANCDQVEINFTIQNIADTFNLCQEKNKTTFEDVSSKIKEIDETANLCVRYSSCYPTSNNGAYTYNSCQDINITTQNLDKVDDIIQVLGNFNNISFYGSCYSIKNKTDCYNNALILAKEDAKQKASAMYQNANLIDLYEVEIFTSCQNSQCNTLTIEARVRARFSVSNEIATNRTPQSPNYIVDEK